MLEGIIAETRIDGIDARRCESPHRRARRQTSSRCSLSHLTQLFVQIDASGKTTVIILWNSYATPSSRHRFLIEPLESGRSSPSFETSHVPRIEMLPNRSSVTALGFSARRK